MNRSSLRKIFLGICVVAAGNLIAIAIVCGFFGWCLHWKAFTNDWMAYCAFLDSVVFFVAFFCLKLLPSDELVIRNESAVSRSLSIAKFPKEKNP